MSTDTPRIDGLTGTFYLRCDDCLQPDKCERIVCVHPDDARTIERQLASVTEERDRLKRELEESRKELCSKDPSYTPLLDKYVADIQAYADRAELAEQQLAASREAVIKECIRLASLSRISHACLCHERISALSASAAKEGK